MRRLACAATLLALGASPGVATAQTRNGPRPALARAQEIALARSAAPEAVSAKARVWVWTGTTYVVGDSGSSVVNCYVGRPWAGSLEPHCFDEEGSATILPAQRRRVELYAQGRTEPEVEREITEAVSRGQLRLPQRPAVTYMMSSAQHLISGTGTDVGAWQPHLMIYYPRLTGDALGLPGFVPAVGFVENPGQPYSALVIPLKTFVPGPQPAK